MNYFRLLSIIILLSSCSSNLRTISEGNIATPTLATLNREDYLIIKDTEGSGSASGVLCFGLFCKKKAQMKAEYEAIGKIGGADMLIAPRYEIKSFIFPIFYRQCKVTVKAKAIQLKTDK